jgi:hypothetical protein
MYIAVCNIKSYCGVDIELHKESQNYWTSQNKRSHSHDVCGSTKETRPQDLNDGYTLNHITYVISLLLLMKSTNVKT